MGIGVGRSAEIRGQRWALAFVSAVAVGFAVRLTLFVDEHAVDLLSGDQWDLWDPLFRGAGLWERWRFQWGPQRQGLGAFVTGATAALSAWNLRAEAFVCGAIVVLASVAALALVRIARGRWLLSDAIVPVVVLTVSQHEVLVTTTNPAHGPLPLLLAMGFALALWIEQPRVRLAALVALQLIISNTGFTFLLGAVIPAIFGLMLWDAVKRRTDVALHAGALALSVASLGLFVWKLRPDSAVSCFQFPDPEPSRYILSTMYLFASGVRVAPEWRFYLGWMSFAVGVGCLALAAWSGWRTLRTRASSPLHLTVFVLSGFSLLFAASAIIGRTCLGPKALDASRYSPYVIPFVVAAYLTASVALPPGPVKTLAIAALCAACLWREWCVRTDSAEYVANLKRAFRVCYLETGDADRCNRLNAVYVGEPGEDTHLAAKLFYLREHHLSFFADR